MYRVIFYVATFVLILNFVLRIPQICSCIPITNDYVSELFDMDLFDNKERTKIKNEIYDMINETHKTYACCKTCIKIIQLLYQIIKQEKKKEKYIDIIIEDILEINLCNPYLWNKHFYYNIALYTEYFLDNSIMEQQKDLNHNINIQTVFFMYSQYLVSSENFIITTKGLPYKIIENKISKEIKIKQNSYVIIQSQIKVIHSKVLQDDFSYGKYRLIKISKLEEKIQELFLKMREGYLFVFFFYTKYHHEGVILPSNSILDVKIKIHQVKDHIKDIHIEKRKKELINDIDGFLLYS
ncbi:hypothetical protein PFHG_04149 [Plasmodium falciparum HB3]|uniref:Uncharacterized protein n=1 Tax=Plasmodium falciparum (isolate HB3) TaxID=137071 RepID=A0A0L7KGG9_PLAFX|nr:hypothetical protein PFHG_04149 [Plasmodium falciparum HB3]